MALQIITTQNGVALDGLYQGQTAPVPIGDIGGNIGPNYFGYTVSEDEVTFNLYFSPGQSPQARNGNWNNIGYVQTGSFYINGVPVSVLFHDEHTLLPVLSLSQSGFADVPLKVADNSRLLFPYYPYWAYVENIVPIANLFKYPQVYGGFTKYNNTPFNAGAYLAAGLIQDISMGTGSLPVVKITATDYFKQLDFDDLNISGTLNTNFPPSTPPETIIGALLSQEKPLIPPDGVVYQVITQNSGDTVIAFEYKVPLRDGLQIVFAALTYKGGNFYKIDYEDVIDFMDDPENGKLNFAAVFHNIFKATGMAFFPPPRNFNISYQFHTYPCSIIEDNINKYIYLQPFEGIAWGIKQTYTTDAGWDNATMIAPVATDQVNSLIWKRDLQQFLAKSSDTPYKLRIGHPGNYIS